ncbi:MAG: hypothetical protein E7300_03525 [Lachnospiraceae bacterium]|nr:hypothetical protein [Lachnospiraceae bacterium]
MIRSADVRAVLQKIPAGKTLSIKEIQDLIEKNCNLTKEDLAPHTKTRPTTYPKWKHVIQGVMSTLKRQGDVAHDRKHHMYTF